jgi:hypothetical protein
MNYVNYETTIVERHHIKLVGWTFSQIASPSEIGMVDDIRALRDALKMGTCRWVRLSKRELATHVEELGKHQSSGEIIGKKRKTRSDKGTQRRPNGAVKGIDLKPEGDDVTSGEMSNFVGPESNKKKRARNVESRAKQNGGDEQRDDGGEDGMAGGSGQQTKKKRKAATAAKPNPKPKTRKTQLPPRSKSHIPSSSDSEEE